MTTDHHALSVRERFVQTLENQILSGELRLGDKLPSARELCAQMGVSLTTVNTGISELASKGFVEVVPRQGVFVADYLQRGTPDALFALINFNGGKLGALEVRNFCESRMAIDPAVAEYAIRRATDEQFDELGLLLEDFRRSETIEEACDRITKFFHKLYILSENNFLALIYYSTIPHQKIMYTSFIEKNGIQHVMDNAEEVYRLLRARDIPGVRACLVHGMKFPLEGETAII